MSKINRRNFFAGIGAGALGLGILKKGTGINVQAAEGSEELKIKRYKTLGKTGLKVSDIIFGSTSFSAASVARYAYDLGVNTFDTAENYMNGRAEEMYGTALKGIRDKIVLISKHFGMRNPGDKITKQVLMDKFEASLKRLQTDYIDVAFTHAIGDASFWDNQELLSAYDQLKKDGKLRFTGFSTHNAPKMLKDCLKPEYKDFIQVAMFIYNHMEGKEIEPLVTELHKRGIGTIAMKTMAGGRQGNLKSFVSEKMTYPHAALAWVLDNPEIDCAVISMRSFSHVEEYVAASGKTLGREDMAVLKKYQQEVDKSYCRLNCDKCESSCPKNVAISDIMRFKMYFEDYGQEKNALEYYAQLNKKQKPVSCASCAGYCNLSCPYGLDVKDNLIEGHKMLSA